MEAEVNSHCLPSPATKSPINFRLTGASSSSTIVHDQAKATTSGSCPCSVIANLIPLLKEGAMMHLRLFLLMENGLHTCPMSRDNPRSTLCLFPGLEASGEYPRTGGPSPFGLKERN